MQIAKRLLSHGNHWALALGIGLALFGIHWREQPLLNYIFLPTLGLLITVVCLALFFGKLKQKPDLGSKYIWIPMLIIVASLTARLVVDFSTYALAGAMFGIVLFCIYVASRKLGKEIFTAFIPFVVIVAISCIVSGITNLGEPTGGIITNYCASAGFMIFGTVVNKFKWQWVLATLVLIALFFTGALEALFAAIVLGIVILARKDWGKRMLAPVVLVTISLIVWSTLGHFTPLWGKNNLDVLVGIATGKTEINHTAIDVATTGRWINITRRMSDIKPLGRGFWITMPQRPDSGTGYYEYSSPDLEPVHNVPLVIVDQIGLAAGIAWLFVTIFCLVKTRWKYAWSAVLILSVFDHYIWTQFAPYWWALIGVSSASTIKSDLIFRKANNE